MSLDSNTPPGFHTVDIVGNPWKPVYINMETHGNCCIGNPWKPMDTNAMGFHGFPHLMETYGNLWKPLWKPMAIVASETRGNPPWTPTPWVSMGFHMLWKHMETYGHFYGNPWQLLHRKLVETHGHQTYGFPWVSTSSGNPWELVHRKPMETLILWKPMNSHATDLSVGSQFFAPVFQTGANWDGGRYGLGTFS